MLRKSEAGLLVFLILVLFSWPFASEVSRPDLKIIRISAARMTGPAILLRIEAEVEVSNSTSQPVQVPFLISLFYRTSPDEPWTRIKDWECPGLDANSTLAFKVAADLQKAASYFFKADADSSDAVIELDEGNNSLEITRTDEEIFRAQALPAHSSAGEKVYAGNLDVLVTAPRMEIPLKDNPAATTVVETSVLKMMPKTIAADEALRLVPGVKVDNQANGERVHLSIRGQGILTERGIRGIKVLLDGLPLNDPTGFAPDFYDVDWATVNRIEVFRGAAASLYGGGASGGILNIMTAEASPKRLSGIGFFDLGAYGFAKGLAEVSGTAGKTDYRVAGSTTHGDGYRVHTKFSSNNLYGKWNFTLSPSFSLTAIAGYTDFFNQNAEGLNTVWLNLNRQMANPDALKYNEYQKTQRFFSGVTGRLGLASNQDLSFSVYFRDARYEESVPSSVLHRKLYTPGSSVQYNLHLGSGGLKNHLSLGSDLQWQSIPEYRYPNLGLAIEGPELLSDQTISQSEIGFYILDRVEFGPEWNLVMSFRYDNVNNELDDHLKANDVDLSGQALFHETTGRIGLTWNPVSTFGVYASWGSGFLPPATEELVNNPDHLGGFNTHLTPATSQGADLGVRGLIGSRLFYDLTFFYLRTDNDFGRYRIPERPLETFYQNVGSSNRYGLETFWSWTPNPSLGMKFAYTYSDFKYTSYQTPGGTISGTRLPNSPVHQVYGDMEYFLAKNLVAGASIYYQSRSYIDYTNLTWIDGYTLFNIRLAYRFEAFNTGLEVLLSGLNIFGTEYIAFTEPDPDGNSYQPGPTAQFTVGLRVYLGGD